jgi:hypothetical protein
MLQVFDGITFSVGQSVEHPLRRLPADLSVRSPVPHRITCLLEFVQDLGDEGLPALGSRVSFSLLVCDFHPEFQLFSHPQFHFSGPLACRAALQISVSASVALDAR